MAPIGKTSVVLGLVIVGIGLMMMYSDKVPFLGKLPGDIYIKKENYQIFVPITTSILASILISLILWLLSFFGKK
jgi:hypothetical protein